MRHWDIFCAVVDNFGDIGVCWRLARQLANEHAARVRLWVDDLATFARLCPQFEPGGECQQVGSIEVRHWSREFPEVEVADVVIEAFACELPQSYIERMMNSARSRTGCPAEPVWINLEYLSAEEWIEDCHQVASPQSKWGLQKYFYFPGFTPRTGGLLRERTLLADRAAFGYEAQAAFWRRIGVQFENAAALRVSLFCYENPALCELLHHWKRGIQPITLMVTPGTATEQCGRFINRVLQPGTSSQCNALSIHALPFLEHADFDRLLWACDVNFVRGEDSFVRAQWAQRPFVWQPYPQSDATHQLKLEAYMERSLGPGATTSFVAEAIRNFWRAWNGGGEIGRRWDDFHRQLTAIEHHQVGWARQLDRLGELTNNLARFVGEIEQRRLIDPHC